MSRQLIEYLAKRIIEEEKSIEDDLILGRCKEFSDYKYSAGILRGFHACKGILQETLERMEKEEDEVN